MKNNFKNFTSVELFAGAGGLALGLEMANFKNIFLIENNKWACETLRFNRPNWKIIEKDITKITMHEIDSFLPNNFDNLDLLSGGYPCQAFSYAGKKNGLNDVRGTLFYNYAEILKHLKPKMFLVENVKGLVNHDNGKTLKVMLDVFSNIGYQVNFKVLNAINYNVAQKRERIIIIGIRKDVKNVVNSDFIFPIPNNKILFLKDILKDVPISLTAQYSEKKRKIFELIPPGGCWKNLPINVAKEYMGKSYNSGGGKTGVARKLSWDEPSLTILCSPNQKQTDRCHPEENRPLSVRETARIQSFPDNWNFKGSMMEQYKQLGNAVPVEFAKQIGISINNYLTKYYNILNKEKNEN